jgi:tRNA-specific 2-thiouridylase
VTALLVRRAGFRAIGLTMKNYCFGDADVPDRSCCSVEAIDDARRECDRLGMPHRMVDVEEFFTREVIDNFVAEYRNARTPNPCVRCNSIVRFKTLVDYAGRIGIDLIATGHYARVFEADDGGRYLGRSKNRTKDQSYFLSGVHGNVLERVLFPLGSYEKREVRDVAHGASMAVAEKKESQEVCFVPEGTLRGFLESRDVPLEPGLIENRRGEVLLGEHNGIAAYTVGQRRGLGVSAPTPKYILELDRARNVVVVGEADELASRGLTCRLAWIDPAVPEHSEGLIVQIRYRHEGAAVKGLTVDGDCARVEFVELQRAVCPGQTVAFYRDDVVVASGVIDEALS